MNKLLIATLVGVALLRGLAAADVPQKLVPEKRLVGATVLYVCGRVRGVQLLSATDGGGELDTYVLGYNRDSDVSVREMVKIVTVDKVVPYKLVELQPGCTTT